MTNLLRYNIVLLSFILSFSALAQNLQDPTRPKITTETRGAPVNSESNQEQLVLQSVFIKDSGYLGVISGDLVKVGDEVQGYKVKKITPNSVTLEQGQTNKKLRLYQHEIKK